MALQLGRCAFTAACIVPGPRFRIRGTNQVICGLHARSFLLSLEAPARAPAEGAAVLRTPLPAQGASSPMFGHDPVKK